MNRFISDKTFKLIQYLFVVLLLMTGQLYSQREDGNTLAHVSLITAASDANKPFVVGIKLDLSDGWHTYWKNPGDSGLPLEVEWTLPEGFTFDELRYPTPKKFISSGSVTYGYEKQVVILCTIKPPKNLAPKMVKLSAKCDWLICHEKCVKGGGAASIIVGELSAKDLETNKTLLHKCESNLPRSLSKIDLKISRAHARVKGDETLVEIQLNGKNPGASRIFIPTSWMSFY